jgi:hypothetical protein
VLRRDAGGALRGELDAARAALADSQAASSAQDATLAALRRDVASLRAAALAGGP